MELTEREEQLVAYITERLYLFAPKILAEMMEKASARNMVVKSFYEKNKDLIPHAPLVGSILQEFDKENPGLGIDKLLEKALPEIRKRVKLTSSLDLTKKPKPQNLNYNGEL